MSMRTKHEHERSMPGSQHTSAHAHAPLSTFFSSTFSGFKSQWMMRESRSTTRESRICTEASKKARWRRTERESTRSAAAAAGSAAAAAAITTATRHPCQRLVAILTSHTILLSR